jgi:hypothetical protein
MSGESLFVPINQSDFECAKRNLDTHFAFVFDLNQLNNVQFTDLREVLHKP